jgi:hypothetical protein
VVAYVCQLLVTLCGLVFNGSSSFQETALGHLISAVVLIALFVPLSMAFYVMFLTWRTVIEESVEHEIGTPVAELEIAANENSPAPSTKDENTIVANPLEASSDVE